MIQILLSQYWKVEITIVKMLSQHWKVDNHYSENALATLEKRKNDSVLALATLESRNHYSENALAILESRKNDLV